jgi:hypothetical protein
MQEFPELTLSSNIGSVMHSDRANGNRVQGKSESAGYDRLPRVLSNPTMTVSIHLQKSLVVLAGFIAFLSCLWMFHHPY